MKRRTLDIPFSIGGAVFSVLLLVLGLVLKDQADFAKTYVHDQLAAQEVYVRRYRAIEFGQCLQFDGVRQTEKTVASEDVFAPIGQLPQPFRIASVALRILFRCPGERHARRREQGVPSGLACDDAHS